MRLGLVLDQIVLDCHGRYSTDEAFFRFLEAALGPTFDRIDFCARVAAAESDAAYAVDSGRFSVCALPWYPNIAAFCLRAPVLLPRTARVFRERLSHWDMLLACGIHPVTSLALWMAKRRGVPSQLWVRGDLGADVRHRYAGFRRVPALAAARLTTAAVPRGTPVVSMGRDDYPFLERMGPLRVAYSSKFGAEDLVARPRSAAPHDRPFRILYVGRISAEKGLDVLYDAAVRLLAERPNSVTFTLVGSDLVGSSYGDKFRARVAASCCADRITMIGYVPYGPPLWSLYDSHDALVLPSFTEGFPQVLLEAMARGLPVVATAVGGVPAVVRDGDNGLLVPAGRPDAIADAIARLARDSALRARLSERALICAAAHTRETQVASIAAFTAACMRRAA